VKLISIDDNCSGAWHWSGVDYSSDHRLTSVAHRSLRRYDRWLIARQYHCEFYDSQ